MTRVVVVTRVLSVALTLPMFVVVVVLMTLTMLFVLTKVLSFLPLLFVIPTLPNRQLGQGLEQIIRWRFLGMQGVPCLDTVVGCSQGRCDSPSVGTSVVAGVPASSLIGHILHKKNTIVTTIK